MTTLAQTVAGTTLSITAAKPATQNSAGYVALTYTTVAEITDIGNFGKDYTLVTHNPLGDRNTYKFKGSYNSGSLDVKLAKALGDAGQTLMKAASNSDADYSFKITFQDGATAYFSAKVMSFITNVGSVNNILGADAKTEITSDIYEVAAV